MLSGLYLTSFTRIQQAHCMKSLHSSAFSSSSRCTGSCALLAVWLGCFHSWRHGAVLMFCLELRLCSTNGNPVGGFKVPAVWELKPFGHTHCQSCLKLSALSCCSAFLQQHMKYHSYCLKWIPSYRDICFAAFIYPCKVSWAPCSFPTTRLLIFIQFHTLILAATDWDSKNTMVYIIHLV